MVALGVVSALLGLGLHAASAAPAGPSEPSRPHPSGAPSGSGAAGGDFIPPVALSPESFSLPDGFPNPSPEQLRQIQILADGVLSNAPPPPKLAPSSLTAFQLIEFNENFEVAFFASLLANITSGLDPDLEKEFRNTVDRRELARVVELVLNQEILHATTAKNILDNFKTFAPPPCVYKFPTEKVADAIRLAETFTAVVLGTLQDASQLFAKNGDDGPVRAVASVIGQEGEQNGFYRFLLDLVPSEKPFLTTNVAPFAFSVLVQNFIVSCPFDLGLIDLPIFMPLLVKSGNNGMDVQPKDQDLTFAINIDDFNKHGSNFKGSDGDFAEYEDMWNKGDWKGMESRLFVTYFTGQQVPISEPIKNIRKDGKQILFDAFFPFEDNVAQALSIASLTTRANITNPDDVPNFTIAAPGLIQVNDRL